MPLSALRLLGWLGALALRYTLMQSLSVEVGMAPLFHKLCSLPRTRVSPANSVAAVNSPCTRGNWIYLMQLTTCLSTLCMSVGVKPKHKWLHKDHGGFTPINVLRASHRLLRDGPKAHRPLLPPALAHPSLPSSRSVDARPQRSLVLPVCGTLLYIL